MQRYATLRYGRGKWGEDCVEWLSSVWKMCVLGRQLLLSGGGCAFDTVPPATQPPSHPATPPPPPPAFVFWMLTVRTRLLVFSPPRWMRTRTGRPERLGLRTLQQEEAQLAQRSRRERGNGLWGTAAAAARGLREASPTRGNAASAKSSRKVMGSQTFMIHVSGDPFSRPRSVSSHVFP